MKDRGQRNRASAPRQSVIPMSKPKPASSALQESREAPPKTAEVRGNGGALSEQERRSRIELTAYYLAQRRRFQNGSALEDWLQAEHDLGIMLRQDRLE